MKTITDLFHERLRGENAGHLDIIEHLPLLHYLAKQCTFVTEFGTRTGNSTIAFLSSGCCLTSYDIEETQLSFPEECFNIFGPVRHPWRFVRANTAELEDILPTCLLFIDTLHTYAQVKAELKHAGKVRRFLAFHDTVLNGQHGENGERGIEDAINEFMQANTGQWRVFCHMRNCNGLLVLERVKQ